VTAFGASIRVQRHFFHLTDEKNLSSLPFYRRGSESLQSAPRP
jgi:hypothetical protein